MDMWKVLLMTENEFVLFFTYFFKLIHWISGKLYTPLINIRLSLMIDDFLKSIKNYKWGGESLSVSDQSNLQTLVILEEKKKCFFFCLKKCKIESRMEKMVAIGYQNSHLLFQALHIKWRFSVRATYYPDRRRLIRIVVNYLRLGSEANKRMQFYCKASR